MNAYWIAGGVLGLIVLPAWAMSDPTRPPDAYESGTASHRYVLSAIIVRGSQPLAMIDGKLVREGDRVGAGKVIRIKADSVDIESYTGDYTLYIGAGLLKKPLKTPVSASTNGESSR